MFYAPPVRIFNSFGDATKSSSYHQKFFFFVFFIPFIKETDSMTHRGEPSSLFSILGKHTHVALFKMKTAEFVRKHLKIYVCLSPFDRFHFHTRTQLVRAYKYYTLHGNWPWKIFSPFIFRSRRISTYLDPFPLSFYHDRAINVLIIPRIVNLRLRVNREREFLRAAIVYNDREILLRRNSIGLEISGQDHWWATCEIFRRFFFRKLNTIYFSFFII